MRAAGAELYLDEHESVPVPRIDGRLLAGMAVGNWRTRAGDLDILQGIPRASEEDRIGHADLLARAEPRPGPGHAILVASLEDIIRSKEVADRPKDREALVELRRLADEVEPVALAGDHIGPGAQPPPDLEL